MTDVYADDAAWAPGPAGPPDPDDGEDAGGQQQPKPLYPDLPTWVQRHLAEVVRRRLGGSLTWCRAWWRHAEAISRLNALWQEWEKARLDGTLSAWWIYHAGPHLDALMSRDSGPFMSCRPSEDGHTDLDPLPCAPSDSKMWQGSAYRDPDAPGTIASVLAAETPSPDPAQQQPAEGPGHSAAGAAS